MELQLEPVTEGEQPTRSMSTCPRCQLLAEVGAEFTVVDTWGRAWHYSCAVQELARPMSSAKVEFGPILTSAAPIYQSAMVWPGATELRLCENCHSWQQPGHVCQR